MNKHVEKNNKYYEKSYNYFVNISKDLPFYIQKNLKKMPNNKGYKWRDVCFFGELPDENNNKTIIYEKKYDKTLIHIYHNKKHTIIEKSNDKKNEVEKNIEKKTEKKTDKKKNNNNDKKHYKKLKNQTKPKKLLQIKK